MNSSRYQHFPVTPISAALGATISDIDLRHIDDKIFSDIKAAFAQFSVLFFPDQQFTPEDHIDFANRFGEINVNRFFDRLADYPMIAEVRKEPEETHNIGSGWHTDHSYDQIPALGSLLYAREVPSVGGDTLFASMYKAYEQLSHQGHQFSKEYELW